MKTQLDKELQEAPYESPRMNDFPVQPRKSRRVLRAVVWIAVPVLLIAGGTLAFMRRPRTPQVHYDTAGADRGTRSPAKGDRHRKSFSALLSVQVGSQVIGIGVQQLFVDYNSPVKKRPDHREA